MVEISLQNGRIRELEEPDLSVLAEMSGEDEIREFYFEGYPPPPYYWQNMLECQKEMRESRSRMRTDYLLPIEEGVVKGLFRINIRPYAFIGKKHLANIGYFVGEEFRNKDVATRALGSAIPFIFGELNSGYIESFCLPQNVASQNLLKRAGFRHFRNAEYRRRGKRLEVAVYRINSPRTAPLI